jgi:transcriptional regulator with XRE-family HTH domain
MDDTNIARNGDNLESDPIAVGAKLRLRRKVRGLSLKEVAEACDVSIAQLSLIERGESPPSLRSLRNICNAISMPMSWLFEATGEEPNPDGTVVHAKHRRTLNLGDRGMVKQLLTPDTCRSVQMMKVIVKPGGSSGPAPYFARGVAECGTVLVGTLGLDIDGEKYTVETGDTFAFEGNHDVRFWCIGDVTCEVIWPATPALY